jgi:hypothetical protein
VNHNLEKVHLLYFTSLSIEALIKFNFVLDVKTLTNKRILKYKLKGNLINKLIFRLINHLKSKFVINRKTLKNYLPLA